MAMSQHAVWIMFHSSQQRLANLVVDCCTRTKDTDKRVGVRSVEPRNVIKWKTFEDGFPNLFIDDVKDMAGKDVIFIASFHSVDVIFEQMSLIYALPRYLAHSVTVILPYFPTGTMERVDLEGQIATASTLAKMLSMTPQCARGPCQFLVFDIHALQERFYFSNAVIPRLESAIPLLIKAVSQKFSSTMPQVSIAFPDEGAEKRFSRSFPDSWSTICLSKYRAGSKRIIKHKEGTVKDRHVVIVDDLVKTGGTLLESIKLLDSMGASTVSAYVTHPVFPEESWRRFVGKETVLDTFWVTDSVPHAEAIAAQPPFVLLSLAERIVDILLAYDLKMHD